MQGGDAGLAHLIVLQLESGKELNYVLKCSGTDENAFQEWGKIREAVFYDNWVPEIRNRV